MTLPSYIVTSSSPVSDVADATDLASTANGKGASLIGIEDAGLKFTGTTVEAALQELGDGTALDARYVNVTGDDMTGKLSVTKNDTNQLKVGYDGSNYATISVSSGGAVDLTATGLDEGFYFNDSVYIKSDSKKLYAGAGNDLSLDYDGTSGNLKTDLIAASDLHIGCGTDKTVVLDETVWVDIDFPIIIRTTGAGIPTLKTLNGNITMPQWAVNDYNVCESQEFIHAWKEGSACYWHLHLTTNGSDGTNRYVAFEVEYGWVNPSGAWTFPTTISSGDLTIPASTADKTMLILSLGNFTPSGGKIGGHVVARLKRVAASGTAPTSNPWVPMLQLHVECDTLGSRQIASK